MSGAFVPVDLDQVLDEFEEQEKKINSPLETSTSTNKQDELLDISHGLVDKAQMRVHAISEPRTYSFNNPLDAILEEHSNNIEGNVGKSLAQELADHSFVLNHKGDDCDSDAESEASSTTAVISAAEQIITKENQFALHVDPSLSPQELTLPTANLNCNENINIISNSTFPLQSINTKCGDEVRENEPDYLSLLNSVVEENPFCVQDSKSQTASFSSIDGSTSSNELTNEIKGLLEDNLKEQACGTTEIANNHEDQTECQHTSQAEMNTCNCDTKQMMGRTNRNDWCFSADEINLSNTASIELSDRCNTNSERDTESSPSDIISNETFAKEGIILDDAGLHSLVQGTNEIELLQDVQDSSEILPSTVTRDQQIVDDINCIGRLSVDLVPDMNEVDVPEDSSAPAELDSPMSDGSADSLCGMDYSQPTDPLCDDDGTPEPERGVSPELQAMSSLPAVHISSGDPEMGFVPPLWVPDEVATHCMTCGLKFSVIKRKHHCRACGKVLCSSCCNMKYPLPYMGNKEARVCQVCCDILLTGSRQAAEIQTLCANSSAITEAEQPTDTCTFDQSEDLPPTCIAPEFHGTQPLHSEVEEVAEREDESHQNEESEVNPDSTEVSVPVLSLYQDSNTPNTDEGSSSTSMAGMPLSPALSDDSDISFRLDIEHVRAIIPQDSSALPPILNVRNKVIQLQEQPDHAEIMYRLKGLGDTVVFLLNKNLIVKVNIVKLHCCVKKKCWCFVTDGMGAASQEEMVVLLECNHNENAVPKDVLSHFNTAFTYAKQGHVVSDLGFTIFGQPFLGSSNNAGFLYVKPSFQCLENLPLPTVPFVIGILIQRHEAPWAQLFPLRLMLRLGTEFRYYPCPLWSVRNRPAVYSEIGHTIMNLLTDFKNFQYSIPRVTGLVIHMEGTKTTIRMPQDRYDEIVKVLNAAEEHMFAFGANFSSEADSHLVCIQEGENYKTQAINMQNKTRKITAASFVVFTGSLKTSNPDDAKVSIIEDGIMVQMLPDAILELRKALREMQDYAIKIGNVTSNNTVNHVSVEWATRDANKQVHISPIDGESLSDVPSIQVQSSCDFTKPDMYRIRWTNVFLKHNGERSRGLSSRGLSHLTAELAGACCEALKPHLLGLLESDLTHLSLRVHIDSDSVEYSIGARQHPLPANLMADMDNALVPAINTAAMKHRRKPLTVELFFSIISLF